MNNIEECSILVKEIARYMTVLEGIFGPRDQRFVFGGMETSRDGTPRTYFPNDRDKCGRQKIQIHVSYMPGQSGYDRGHTLWQIAHECVHLLDPCHPPTNNLEEGLASWFQDCASVAYHREETISYAGDNKCRNDNYVRARDRVSLYVPRILCAIELIRQQGHRLGEISSDELLTNVEGIDRATAIYLSDRFSTM